MNRNSKCSMVLRLPDGTYLEKNGTVPAEADGQAANGDDDALLPLPQLLADRLPPHVQVPVLRSQRAPSKQPEQLLHVRLIKLTALQTEVYFGTPLLKRFINLF